MYLWPILKSKSGQDEDPEYAEFSVHSGSVTALEVSYDQRFLVSSSEDGCIFFLRMTEFTNGIDLSTNITSQQNMIKARQYYQSQKCKVHQHMNNLSLVFKSALDQKAHKIQELKYKAENLKAYYQEERNSTANRYAEEINELNAQNDSKYNQNNQNFEKDLIEEQQKIKIMIKTNHLEHQIKLTKLNGEYEGKLKIAYAQRDKLVDQYEKIKEDYKTKLDDILSENKKALTHFEKEYKDKYEELQKNHTRLNNDKKRDGEKFNIALDQCEEEYELEIHRKKQEFNEYMTMLNREMDELKDTRDEYKREIDKLDKKILV